MSKDLIRFQSAVIPYRKKNKTLQIMLITSRGSGRWVLPKGNIEADMTPRQSAIVEAFEEAGINGRVPKSRFGEYVYQKVDKKKKMSCRVEVFEMQVTTILTNWPEKFQRNRSWMTIEEAVDSINEKELKTMLKSFKTKKLNF